MKTLLAKINDKTYGRKVTSSELIELALSLINKEHFESLRSVTLSNQDKLNLEHQRHQETHGKIRNCW